MLLMGQFKDKYARTHLMSELRQTCFCYEVRPYVCPLVTTKEKLLKMAIFAWIITVDNYCG